MRKTSPGAYLVRVRSRPDSRTSAMPPGRRPMAKWISIVPVAGPTASPMDRKVVVSEAVNSTYPSPPGMRCRETAPASAQRLQPDVLRSEFPLAITLTRPVHATATAGAVLAVGDPSSEFRDGTGTAPPDGGPPGTRGPS